MSNAAPARIDRVTAGHDGFPSDMQPVPFPDRIDTRRFALRRYSASDAPALSRLVAANRNRLIRNFRELATDLTTPAEVSTYLEANAVRWKDCERFVYGIWLESADALVGQLTVKALVWNIPSAELSYFIDGAWLRRGIATEAIQAILEEAFERRGFRRLSVRIIEPNTESLGLAIRMGFRHEGVHRSAFRCGLGELHDVHVFAMTDRDHRGDMTIPESIRARQIPSRG